VDYQPGISEVLGDRNIGEDCATYLEVVVQQREHARFVFCCVSCKVSCRQICVLVERSCTSTYTLTSDALCSVRKGIIARAAGSLCDFQETISHLPAGKMGEGYMIHFPSEIEKTNAGRPAARVMLCPATRTPH